MTENLTPKTTSTTSTTSWNYTCSELAKGRVFVVTLTGGAKKWFKSIPTGSVTSLKQLSTLFLQHFQATRKTTILLAHLYNVKQKKGGTLKSYINCFNEMSNFMTCSPDAGILAHLINGCFLRPHSGMSSNRRNVRAYTSSIGKPASTWS